MNRKSDVVFSRRQKGAMSLLEMMGVLLIGLVLAIGGMYALGTGRSAGKMSQESDQMRSLIGLIPRMATVNGYGAAGTNLVPTIIARKIYPDGMTVSGNSLINKVGGTIAVTSTGLGFTVTSPGYSQDQCGELATQISGMRGMVTSINNTANTGVVDSPTATTQCTGSTNSISWTMES